MFLAKKIKEESEVGYILYMWQVEDLIRAYDFDTERIEKEYLLKFRLEGEALQQEIRWWNDMVEMMRQENVVQSGHLQIAKGTLALLSDKHMELLADSKEIVYNALYYKTLPYIVELRSKGNNKEKNELELCLEVLYGVMLLRMQQREVTQQTQQAHDNVAALLTLLNQKYKEEKKMMEGRYE